MAGRGKKDKEKEIDPMVLMARKFRAKCLFRALGRLVILNTHWLIEGIDHYEGDDVKKRVEQAVRGKAKKKPHLLSITDKALLNKPAEERTEEEKRYLYRIIGGLKCFKRYPHHVKKKLAAVAYFKYYGPGRVIVREHQEAHALYFIISGDVVVSQLFWDEVLQENMSMEIGVMHHGEMFGEVSLLHNILRTATVTTMGHCEFLALMKEDFKNVLQASVQKQWDQVHRAMTAFTYFDGLDEVALREGCIVARMKHYKQNDTVLGDGISSNNFVFFILSGRCQMIESMQVSVTKRLGREFYQLYDPYVPKKESSTSLDQYFLAYKDKFSSSLMEKSGTIIFPKSDHSTHVSAEPNASILQSEQESKVQSPRVSSRTQDEPQKLSISSAKKVSIGGESRIPTEKKISTEKDGRPSIEKERKSSIMKPNPETAIHEEQRGSGEFTLQPEQEASSHAQEETNVSKSSVRMSIISAKSVKPPNLRTYFMQTHLLRNSVEVTEHLFKIFQRLSHDYYIVGKSKVVQFNPGSTFGFGEEMRDRRIIALTDLHCMLIPKVWLLQKNTANIWTRIEHYLKKKIPSKKQLFKGFVSERRWAEYKDQVIEDVVSRTSNANWTCIHDVPYSIRIQEMCDV